MKFKEFKHEPVEPDTYEASMALNQLMRIGKHAIKLHNMIDDDAEMESWVASKIDLAGDYVKKVYNYTEGEKAGLYDDGGMTEIKKMPKGTGTMYGVKEDAGEQALANELSKYYQDAADGLDAEDHGNEEHEDYLDMARSFKKGLQSGMDSVNSAGWEFSTNDFDMGRDGKGEVHYQMAELLKKYNVSAGIKNGESFLIYNGKAITKPAQESVLEDAGEKIANMAQNMTKDEFMSNADELGLTPKEAAEYYEKMQGGAYAHKFEDAGEGHMSKSTLYHTAKYAIALMGMIKKGDDLEGWVQSKLNKAADYLQGAYNYEEYQKLNPYREELDNNMIARHSQIIQKNIDEILDKETEVDDIDTKPGMMRILAKRVNEVEKKLAKETRKQDEGKMSDIDTDMKSMSDEDFMKKYKKSKEQMKKDLNEDGHMDVPSAIRNCETIIEDAMQMKQKLQTMEGELPSWMTQMIAVAASDLNDARDYLLNPTTESGIMYRAGVKKYGKKGMTAIQSAAGKGASHQEIGKIKDKFIKDEEQFDEGLKDWAKGLAMAGVIVAGLAGVGSIQNAIDNSVPAVQAMNKAYEMAMDAGNTELADMIKKDLSAVKVRLDSGKDLNFVKAMQEKYGKFMTTEGLAYESKLAVLLNQRIK